MGQERGQTDPEGKVSRSATPSPCSLCSVSPSTFLVPEAPEGVEFRRVELGCLASTVPRAWCAVHARRTCQMSRVGGVRWS